MAKEKEVGGQEKRRGKSKGCGKREERCMIARGEGVQDSKEERKLNAHDLQGRGVIGFPRKREA